MANKQYDLTLQQQRILQEKAMRRAALREEFLKQTSNPYRHAVGTGGSIFDASVQRFQAMKVSGYEHFKPSSRATWNAMVFFVIPTALVGYYLKNSRDTKEKQIRTGQIAYRDRQFKFV